MVKITQMIGNIEFHHKSQNSRKNTRKYDWLYCGQPRKNNGTLSMSFTSTKNKDENKLNSAEMRMLRWARGKTRLDHIRNEDIRKEARMKPVETFLENKRLNLFKWPLLEARTQSYLCEIVETRSFCVKEQRSTEREMEEDSRYGTRSKILDD